MGSYEANGGGFRTFCTVVAPRPLQGDNGARYLFNLGLGLDFLAQKEDEGTHAHFVIDGPASALPYIGADRLVLRGLTESDDSYRARLQRAVDDYQHAGNAWAVLSQALGYLLAKTPAVRTVSSFYDGDALQTSQWNAYAEGASGVAPPTHTAVDPGNWDWDSVSPSNGSWRWWRWYLVIESVAPQNWVNPAPKFGETGYKIGEAPYAIGVDVPSDVGKSLKIIIGQWGSQVCDWVIVTFDTPAFTVDGAIGFENPAGQYGRWSKLENGVYVRARNPDARYFQGHVDP